MSEQDNAGAKQNGNPGNGSSDKPQGNASGGADLNQLKSSIVELTEKLETVKRQYSGSSEEAIRLKKELEQKNKELETLKKSPTSKLTLNDDAFNQIAEKEGTVVAIQKIIEETIRPIHSKVEKVFEKESKVVLDNFKANHPGIEGEAEVKFTKELERLKGVYDSIEEAMESAYVLAGLKPSPPAPNAPDPKALKEESNKQKEDILKKAQGGAQDSKPTPSDPNDEVKTKIEDLRFKAMMEEAKGNDSTALWVQIDKLSAKLASKV